MQTITNTINKRQKIHAYEQLLFLFATNEKKQNKNNNNNNNLKPSGFYVSFDVLKCKGIFSICLKILFLTAHQNTTTHRWWLKCRHSHNNANCMKYTWRYFACIVYHVRCSLVYSVYNVIDLWRGIARSVDCMFWDALVT